MTFFTTLDSWDSDIDQRIIDLMALIERDPQAAAEAIGVLIHAFDEMNAGGDDW